MALNYKSQTLRTQLKMFNATRFYILNVQNCTIQGFIDVLSAAERKFNGSRGGKKASKPLYLGCKILESSYILSFHLKRKSQLVLQVKHDQALSVLLRKESVCE